jgi:tetratricopeptide (TPR) repeat protein
MKDGTNEAITLLRRAAEKRPDDLSIKEKLFGAYITAGLFDDAVQEFFNLVRSRPDWPQVHFENIGRYSSGAVGRVHSAFERAATAQPSNALAWYGLGFMQQILGNQKAAGEAFRQGISANSAFAPLHYNLGVALMDDADQAAQHLQNAIACSPTMAEPHYALATIYMTRNRKKAIYHFREFMRLAPPHLQGFIEEARFSLQLLGDPEE